MVREIVQSDEPILPGDKRETAAMIWNDLDYDEHGDSVWISDAPCPSSQPPRLSAMDKDQVRNFMQSETKTVAEMSEPCDGTRGELIGALPPKPSENHAIQINRDGSMDWVDRSRPMADIVEAWMDKARATHHRNDQVQRETINIDDPALIEAIVNAPDQWPIASFPQGNDLVCPPISYEGWSAKLEPAADDPVARTESWLQKAGLLQPGQTLRSIQESQEADEPILHEFVSPPEPTSPCTSMMEAELRERFRRECFVCGRHANEHADEPVIIERKASE